MVFLSSPFSLNSYESTNDPTSPRLASLSELSSALMLGFGDTGGNGLLSSVTGVEEALVGYGSPGLIDLWLRFVALFFSPGGKGLLS